MRGLHKIASVDGNSALATDKRPTRRQTQLFICVCPTTSYNVGLPSLFINIKFVTLL